MTLKQDEIPEIPQCSTSNESKQCHKKLVTICDQYNVSDIPEAASEISQNEHDLMSFGR